MSTVQLHHHLRQLEKFADILSRGKEYNITEMTTSGQEVHEVMHLSIRLAADFRVTVAPTVWSTHAHHNGVSPYSPPLSSKEPLRLILPYQEHMKIPPPSSTLLEQL
jgi:hypothetical protein